MFFKLALVLSVLAVTATSKKPMKLTLTQLKSWFLKFTNSDYQDYVNEMNADDIAAFEDMNAQHVATVPDFQHYMNTTYPAVFAKLWDFYETYIGNIATDTAMTPAGAAFAKSIYVQPLVLIIFEDYNNYTNINNMATALAQGFKNLTAADITGLKPFMPKLSTLAKDKKYKKMIKGLKLT